MQGKECWRSACPLAVAGVLKRHVMRFWLGRNQWGTDRRFPLPQGFDLGLDDHEGNCDACMLKGYGVLAHIERQRPGTLDWWIAEEDEIGEIASNPNGARFVTEYTYRQIQQMARSSAELPGIDLSAIEDCTGEVCHGEVNGIAVGDEIDDTMHAWLIAQLAKMHELPPAREKVAAAVGDLFGSAP